MALHIRDFRHSDATGLSQLRERAHRIGAPLAQDAGAHILVGLRDGALTGAIWLISKGDTGMLTAVLVEPSAGWQSDARELIAEACLWLVSRGAARIDLQALPEVRDLRAGLLDMDFRPDAAAGTMKRLVRSPSAA
jgi:GNAT superfamily N-acetyltransferase